MGEIYAAFALIFVLCATNLDPRSGYPRIKMKQHHSIFNLNSCVFWFRRQIKEKYGFQPPFEFISAYKLKQMIK